MKSTILFCSILFIPFFLSAQYRIEAHLTGFDDGTVFYLKDIEADQVLDSTVLKNKSFNFYGSFDDVPYALWVYTIVGNQFYYCNLLMGNEHVVIKGAAKEMPYYISITGSGIQDTDNILRKKTAGFSVSRDSLVNIVVPLMNKDENPELQKNIWNQIRKIDDTMDIIKRTFIDKNINSYAGLRQLFFYRFRLDSSTLHSLYNQLKTPFRESRYAKTIATFLKVGMPLKTGEMSWNFKAIDSSGKQYQLSDYKGQFVLINFSTTYCGPCILSKDELKAVAVKYENQLSVLTFNADASRSAWLAGIYRDQPSWPVLWDGNSGHSETVLKYGVQGYPTFVLIDPDGKIVHRWSGYGKGSLLSAMENKMPEQNN
jgi:thiol-disulfide isomerase/thioredoxin